MKPSPSAGTPSIPSPCLDSKSFATAATGKAKAGQPHLSSADFISMIKKGTTTTSPPLPNTLSKERASPPPLPTIPKLDDDFGIRGLLESIRRLPADRNYWAIGADLESLNMPLSSTPDDALGGGGLSRRMAGNFSPFYGDLRVLPPPLASSSMSIAQAGFAVVPPAYCQMTVAQQDALRATLPGKLASMADATLLLIFHLNHSPEESHPIAQTSGHLLVSRGWRFWKRHSRWIQHNGHAADLQAAPASERASLAKWEPVVTAPLLYWDVRAWTKRPWDPAKPGDAIWAAESLDQVTAVLTKLAASAVTQGQSFDLSKVPRDEFDAFGVAGVDGVDGMVMGRVYGEAISHALSTAK